MFIRFGLYWFETGPARTRIRIPILYIRPDETRRCIHHVRFLSNINVRYELDDDTYVPYIEIIITRGRDGCLTLPYKYLQVLNEIYCQIERR